jgi:hypothetical protein
VLVLVLVLVMRKLHCWLGCGWEIGGILTRK